MHALRLAARRSDWHSFVIGATLTIVIVLATARSETATPLALPLVALLFSGALAVWVVAPHVAAAATIPLFVLIPAGKIFVTPWIGPFKDIVVLGAAGAVVVMHRASRRHEATRIDGLLIAFVVTLLGLYFVNLGGIASGDHHGIGWAQGFRLVAEPLILLVAGATLARPQRTLRWACSSMVATGCFAALTGIVQQLAGAPRLVELGYEYRSQVRTIGGSLRSFGTLDEPFAYAVVLLLALATVMFWMRPGKLATAAASLISVGLALSYVRSAAVVAVALIALWLVRRRQMIPGLAFLAVAVLSAFALLIGDPGASETRTSQLSGRGEYLTLNGRTTAWTTVVEDAADLPFGLGVGKVGTAAERAQVGAVVGTKEADDTGSVDSGYFAAVADVGLVGLGVLLALLGRLVVLGVRGTRLPGKTAWLVLAYVVVIALDAATRSSFTGFPSAFIGFLLIGVGLAALVERQRSQPARLRV